MFQTKLDLFWFDHNLHLKFWYASQPTVTEGRNNTPTPDTTFKPKSTLSSLCNNATLMTFTKKVDHDIEKLFSCTKHDPTHNLSKKEHVLLDELSTNDDIILRSADKGGAIVILDKHKCISEAHHQLNNTTYYQKLTHNPLKTMTAEFHSFLNQAKDEGWISVYELVFLQCEYPTTPTFSLLPKVHKEPKDNPLGQPIISANNSLTEPASQQIDHFIKPLVPLLPSY